MFSGLLYCAECGGLLTIQRYKKNHDCIEELTPEILHSFIDKIYIDEAEIFDGKKMQGVRIVYNFVGAIVLPQYCY